MFFYINFKKTFFQKYQTKQKSLCSRLTREQRDSQRPSLSKHTFVILQRLQSFVFYAYTTIERRIYQPPARRQQ